MSYTTLLRKLGYENVGLTEVPKEAPFHNPGVTVAVALDDVNNVKEGRFVVRLDDKVWYLHAKVVLSAAELNSVACIAAKFAPEGSTVSLQADTHGAGSIFVGMVMTFNESSIPINLVSGDIGCGLTVIPVVTKHNRQQRKLSGNEHDDNDFHSYVLATIRGSLIRGKAAEEGFKLNNHLRDAAQFYGEEELTLWLDQMYEILHTAGFDIHEKPAMPQWAVEEVATPSSASSSATSSASSMSFIPVEPQDPEGLTRRQADVLRYIGRFAQSLGSSGNHMAELATDDQNGYWLVIHSGSRGLGAKVYEVIAQACRVVTGGDEIATGELAKFYAKAYDTLNKFAKLNRVLCAITILKNMDHAYDINTLQDIMQQSYLFEPAIAACHEEKAAMLSLLSGLTHNGIKAFVNDTTREVLYVLSKGAVAMTKRAAASIVALRAGDGCYLWTLANPLVQWREEDVGKAAAKNYTTVYHSDDVIYSGHGAGRSQSTTKTEKSSTFEDMVLFFEDNHFAGNIAPGMLGDNPRIAYKPVQEIISHLPLDLACTKSLLRTRVSYKEGISFKQPVIEQCAKYTRENWDKACEPLADGRPSLRCLWFDVRLCQRLRGKPKQDEVSVVFTTEEVNRMVEHQAEVKAAYVKKHIQL